MTAHTASLEEWHQALAKAIRDRAIDAVPGILVRMARDGWGHEAEEARRAMAAGAAASRVSPSLAELTGHDRAAAERLTILVAVYRRHGISGLRDAVDGYLQMSTAEQDVAIIAEAVLQLAERGGEHGRHAAEAFDRAEAADDRERERTR